MKYFLLFFYISGIVFIPIKIKCKIYGYKYWNGDHYTTRHSINQWCSKYGSFLAQLSPDLESQSIDFTWFAFFLKIITVNNRCLSLCSVRQMLQFNCPAYLLYYDIKAMSFLESHLTHTCYYVHQRLWKANFYRLTCPRLAFKRMSWGQFWWII